MVARQPEVLDAVLALAVWGLVQLFDDPGASRSCPVIMRLHVLNKDGEALRPAADLRRSGAAWPSRSQHDPGIAQVHLRAVGGFAVAEAFDETKGSCELGNCGGDVLVHDVRHQDIGRDGTVVQHGQIVERPTHPLARPRLMGRG